MIEMPKVNEHKNKKKKKKNGENDRKNIRERKSSEHFIIEQLCLKLFKPLLITFYVLH